MRATSCVRDRSPRDEAGAELVPGFYFCKVFDHPEKFAFARFSLISSLLCNKNPCTIGRSSSFVRNLQIFGNGTADAGEQSRTSSHENGRYRNGEPNQASTCRPENVLAHGHDLYHSGACLLTAHCVYGKIACPDVHRHS